MKWSCPNIHDLVNILEKVKVELILDNVFDKRLSKLDDITLVQLREECAILNLDKKGRKADLISHLQMVLGEDAQVNEYRLIYQIY